jgi:hypothetical protein
MSHARAPHLRLVTSGPAPRPVREPRLKFKPVVRLSDGAPFGLHVETDLAFEDTFRPRHLVDSDLPSASAWLGEMIERSALLAISADAAQRPLSLTAPLAALAERDAPMAAEAGARRANVLPQEFRIDFLDASVTALDDLAMDRLDAFRRLGFRVGLDARTGWRTPMNARARITFEAVRLHPSRLDALEIPMSRLEVASAEGVALIAEHASWRDTGYLSEIGVHFAMAPRADA